MARLIIAIGVAATLGDACDVFKHGRVSVDVEGMSDTCCSSVSTLVEKNMKAAEKAGGALTPQQEQEAQMAIMTAMMSDCCGAKDQGILSTLMPEEPPEAGQQIEQMCAAGGPQNFQSSVLAAKLLRISPLLSPVKRTSAAVATLKVWPQTWFATQPNLLAAKECAPPPDVNIMDECPAGPQDCSCATLKAIRSYIDDSANGCSAGLKDGMHGMMDPAMTQKGCDASRLAAEGSTSGSSFLLAVCMTACCGGLLVILTRRRRVSMSQEPLLG